MKRRKKEKNPGSDTAKTARDTNHASVPDVSCHTDCRIRNIYVFQQPEYAS